MNKVPGISRRLFGVWYRHYRVYTKHLFTNGFPPFVEPLIFLGAIGIGAGRYMDLPVPEDYLSFLASGLVVTTAMFTSAFECSYGTYIRLNYDRVYDGILASPVTVADLVFGEVLWAGTKGAFFSFSVLLVMGLFSVLDFFTALPVVLLGLVTGIMFSLMSLTVTSLIRDINQFNFYFTGLISPMFFFSGVVFPLKDLPPALLWVSEILPLTHAVRLSRYIIFGNSYFYPSDIIYCLVFISISGMLSYKRLQKLLVL
jgi:lipooligosaccharide transport system permease protein